MARTYQRSELRDRAQDLVDDDNSDLLSEAQYNVLIDESYAWLYDELIQSGIYPSISDHDISTSGTETEALASDNYKVLVIHYQLSSTQWLKLLPMHIEDWTNHLNISPSSYATRYLLTGDDTVRLFPQPPSGQTYRVKYVPAPAKLALDTTTVDGVSGWEMLIVYDVAIKARIRERLDAGDLVRERQVIYDRLQTAKHNKMTQGPQVPTMRRQNFVGDDPASFVWYTGRRRW